MRKILFYCFLFIITAFDSAFVFAVDNDRQRIPVFLGSDNNYAPYVATTMASVLKNTKSHIDFYILSNQISPKNKRKIRNTKNFFPNKSFSVKFVEIDMNKFSQFNEGFGFITQTSYTRWLIPEIDKNLEKAIWLDCDIILQGDIAELYNENLDGKIVGAVNDMTDIVHGKKRHQLLKKYTEFKNIEVWNSGVQLIDCKKWRENDITNKLIAHKKQIIRYHAKNNTKIGSSDQDTSNIVLQDYKILPLKYNTHPLAVDICRESKTCEELFQNSGDNLLNEAIVLHYATPDKPWKTKKVSTANKFWEMVQCTDFDNEINEKYAIALIENALKLTENALNSNEINMINITQNVTQNVETVKKTICKFLYVIVGINIVMLTLIVALFVYRRKV